MKSSEAAMSLQDEVCPFVSKAKEFLCDLSQGIGYREVQRDVGFDVATLKVGTGKHAGLVYKDGKVTHAHKADRNIERLLNHISERGYELVRPPYLTVGESYGIVQQYFDEPTLGELCSYMEATSRMQSGRQRYKSLLDHTEKSALLRGMLGNDDAISRCRALLDQPRNRDLTLPEIIDARREFYTDTTYLRLYVKESNVIVLGKKNNQERIGLAIIDY
jgi:hypothetical protein